MEWIFYAVLANLFSMFQYSKFLSSDPTRAGAGDRRTMARTTKVRTPNRAAWLPAIFFLEAAAVILTLLAIRHLVGDTGDGLPIAVWALDIWTVLLVAATIRTVAVWRGLLAGIT
jgi:hypothetical protein